MKVSNHLIIKSLTLSHLVALVLTAKKRRLSPFVRLYRCHWDRLWVNLPSRGHVAPSSGVSTIWWGTSLGLSVTELKGGAP